jgi:type VI secretion system secreted protein VgrG
MEKSQGPVTLQGPAWSESFAFRSLHVSEGLSEPFSFELELLSDSPRQDPKKILGQALTICLDLGAAGMRYFNGHVTELSSRGSLGEFFLYRLTLRPWLWLLSRTSNCRVFQKLTVPDIAKQIFRLHGFGDFSEALSSSYDEREFVVQYRESDLHFLSRLLEDEGIYYFFQHEAGKHTLLLCDSPSAHDATPFYPEVPYFPRDRARSEQLDHIDTWEVTQAVESSSYSIKDFDFEKPTAPLLVSKSADAENEQGTFELFDFPGNHKEVSVGERRASVRLEEVRGSCLHCSGEGNVPGLSVGFGFTLSEFPIEEYNRDYLVVSLDATLRSHELESGGANPGELYRCQFRAIDSSQQFRPRRVTGKPSVQGIQTAIVVGKAGEEIWTDEHARVKIKFHWDRYVPEEEENASCWVRVAQLWAGSGFGGIHIPRIGQEVIVEFLDGDPDRPLVVGRVYNSDNKPPYDLPKNQTQSGIRSRSTLKGRPDNCNEIRFEDKKGEEELFIQAENTQRTTVKGSQIISVVRSRTISVGEDQSTTVSGNEVQTYEADRKMDVTGTDTETVHGAHSASYENGRTLTVSGADDVLKVNGVNRTTSVDGEYRIDTSKKYQLSHEANQLLLDGAKSQLSNGKCTLTFEGATATISAADEIRLECGTASIRLTKDGTITISAAHTLTASGSQGAMELGPTGSKLSGLACSMSGTTMSEVTGALVKIN